MADSAAISALKRKRAELTGELKVLRKKANEVQKSIRHVDATLTTLDARQTR